MLLIIERGGIACSQSLHLLIFWVKKCKSNNHYAEHLIRTIGRNQNPDIYSDALEEGLNM